MRKSPGEITDLIIALEQKHFLFDWQIDKIFIWEIIRYRVYEYILYYSEKGDALKKISSIGPKLANKIARYINALIYNPFFDRSKSDILVFESSRKLMFNKEYIDPHTKFTVDELLNQGLSVSKIQSSYSFDRLAKKDIKIKHLDSIYFIGRFISSISSFAFTKDDVKKIKNLENEIKSIFGIDTHLSSLIKKEILFFKSNYSFFNSLFERKKPKKIFLVNFCDKPALIAAAKLNYIKVIDIQHGFISSKDIIYHYPGVTPGSLNYFPDLFYCWKKTWQKGISIPLKEENIIEYGNKYLEHKAISYNSMPKNPFQIIVISQPGLTKEIAQTILANIENLSSFKIEYKLHPKEYNANEELKEIKELKSLENVSFVSKNEDLYQKLTESTYCIGVYSGVLIEALNFNCKCLLLNLLGVEMMTPFIDGSNFKMIDFIELKNLRQKNNL